MVAEIKLTLARLLLESLPPEWDKERKKFREQLNQAEAAFCSNAGELVTNASDLFHVMRSITFDLKNPDFRIVEMAVSNAMRKSLSALK